jgi:hypothetical protein
LAFLHHITLIGNYPKFYTFVSNHPITIRRNDAVQADFLKLKLVLAAKHNFNLMPLVPQVWIAGNHRDVFRVRRHGGARSDFAHHMRQPVHYT